MDDVNDDDGEEGDEGEDDESGEEGEEGDEGDDQDEDEDQDMDQRNDSAPVVPASAPEVHVTNSVQNQVQPSEDTQPTTRPLSQPDRGSPLKHSTSVPNVTEAANSPHDDEAEADGDDDDVDQDQAAPVELNQQNIDLPANYYQSHSMNPPESMIAQIEESYDDDQDMLADYPDEDNNDVNLIQGEVAYNDQSHLQSHHDQQNFGFQDHTTQAQQSGVYGHQQDQFQMPSAIMDFAEQPVSIHAQDASFALMENTLAPQQPTQLSDNTHEMNQGEAQDSFEDLLAGGLDVEDDGDDLMAGLDKHLLESASDPMREQPETMERPVVDEPDEVAISEGNGKASQAAVDVDIAAEPVAETTPADEPEPESAEPMLPEPPTATQLEIVKILEVPEIPPIAPASNDDLNVETQSSEPQAEASAQRVLSKEEEEEQRAIEEMGGVPLSD